MDEQAVDPQKISPEFCVGNNLRMASRAITQAYDGAMRSLGITSTQFSLLGTLYHRGPLPMVQLAEVMRTDRTTVARNLKPLERDGLITVTAVLHDKRVKLVALSPLGEQKLREAGPKWWQVQQRLVEGLGDEQVEALMTILAQLHQLT